MEPAVLDVPLASLAPFAFLLLAIALLPLLAGRFWHRNRNKALVAAFFAVATVCHLGYLQWITGQPLFAALSHEIAQYVSFILLLGSLYTVSGGIVVSGDLRPTPWTNTAFLAVGAILANLIGTTGASVLLIRPFLRINRDRMNKTHLPVFFIITVSNLGGLLTPLGDPPLFLGFLHEVPFFWTLSLWPVWLVANGCVLATFYVWDRWNRPESAAKTMAPCSAREPLRLRGLVNLLLLAGVIGAVLVQSMLPGARGDVLGGCGLLSMGALSLWLTPKALRQANAFTWEPMVEVAILFAGIFITMVPALVFLGAHRQAIGISRPWEYFWLTGLLSSCLDNAPTYLTFATHAAGSTDFRLLADNQVAGIAGTKVLQAISCGAVLMGALTYIGNGPNFMVKAIAHEANFPTPSFFGYLGYSLTILLPVFVLITLIFFGSAG